ncbi:MAG: Tn3 family transposase [Sandaracinaceae bacterium]
MAAGLFLSVSERARLQAFPAEVGRPDLAAYFTLTEADRAQVVRCRGDRSQLGFALVLCAIRYLGFVPADVDSASAEVLAFVAKQLNVSPDVRGYGARAKTRTDHIGRALRHLGFRRARRTELRELDEWLVRQASAHARPSVLLADACERLLRARVLRPGVTVLERHVLDARLAAERRTFDSLHALIEPVRDVLERLLRVDAELEGTRLTWLRERARSNSPRAIQGMLDKHEWLAEAGVAEWDVSPIHPNRLRFLARLGRTADAQMLGRMPERRRYPVLVAFLRQSLVDITDELIDMFSQCLAETQARARRALRQHRREVQQARDEVVHSFVAMSRLILDPKVSDRGLRRAIHKTIPKKDLARLLDACEGPARPLDTEGLDFLRSRYAYIRQFSARFIGQLDVRGDAPAVPVLDAVRAVRDADEGARRALPSGVTTEFVPKRWEPFVFKKAGVDRAYYELCALWGLRGALRSGQAWVEHSRRYASTDSYLISPGDWSSRRHDAVSMLGVPAAATEGLAAKAELLRTLGQSVRGPEPVRLVDGDVFVPPLVAEPRPESLVQLEAVVAARLPRVELPELLVEVDRWTGFSRQLVHATNETPPRGRGLFHAYATVLAQATNLGFTRMAQVADMTFDQLAFTSAWHVREETLKAAFGRLVDFQHAQPISKLWGGGTLSSSDGQRFPVTGKSSVARAIPRYFGFGRGVTFYTWVASEFSQYGIRVIPSTVRDATYLLDAILDNETELEVMEHTTDTHGYTDLVFALFDLLGLRFAPRIADVGATRLYDLAGSETALAASGLPVARNIKPEVIAGEWDAMLRVAGSLKLGFVTASLLVSKLQAQPRRGVVRALLEYGRICKTEHVLRYLAEEGYRRRIGAQLNKGEAIHALRRFLVFGNLARLTRKDLAALVNQAGCLNLVSNAVIVWNTVYMERVIESLRAEGHVVRDADLARLSPARFEHINPFGKYRFDEVPPHGTFRSLQT